MIFFQPDHKGTRQLDLQTGKPLFQSRTVRRILNRSHEIFCETRISDSSFRFDKNIIVSECFAFMIGADLLKKFIIVSEGLKLYRIERFDIAKESA
ncbi:MAG: hypothetical protein IIA62_06845 [Nitrospinae bacterium]|nr:hypothetical protein [Nitrospinota bacterium]